MDPVTAYRAIIRLLDGDVTGYEAIVDGCKTLVDARYFYSKNRFVEAKLDTHTGKLYIGSRVKNWGRVSAC